MKFFMILYLFTASLLLAEVKSMKVFVSLCDNKTQGIIPVGVKIGDGDKPEANLYWGCSDGFGSYFRKSEKWIVIKSQNNVSNHILRRLNMKHSSGEIILEADAYRGANMSECIKDFELAITSGRFDLVAFIGHNPYMDQLPGEVIVGSKKCDVIVLSCKSQPYFESRIRRMNANPILLTRQLMYPGSFILHDCIEAWLNNKGNVSNIRAVAGKAYAKNQRISVSAATGVFADLSE